MRQAAGFRRAIVHIGVHKTGTTTIQQTFFTYRSVLRTDYEVYFPALGSAHGLWLYSIFCEAPHQYPPNMKGGYNTLESAREINRHRLRRLEAALTAEPMTTLLLSEEDLSFLSPEGVQRFAHWLRGFAKRVSVIVFLREPIAWATSRTQEALRQTKTLEQVYANPLSFKGLRNRLTPWLHEFGREAISVRDYDEATNHAYGIVGAFCELCGIPASFPEKLDVSLNLNKSLSALGARLLSELNRSRPLFVGGGVNPTRAIDDYRAFERIRGRPFQLPRDVVLQVIEDSREDCEWAAENLGIKYELTLPREMPSEGESLEQESLESLALLIGELWRDAKLRGRAP